MSQDDRVKWGKMAKNNHHLLSKGYGLEYDPVGFWPCVKVLACIKMLTLTYFQWFKAEKNNAHPSSLYCPPLIGFYGSRLLLHEIGTSLVLDH